MKFPKYFNIWFKKLFYNFSEIFIISLKIAIIYKLDFLINTILFIEDL